MWLVKWDDWSWWRMDNSEHVDAAFEAWRAGELGHQIVSSVDYGGSWGRVETEIDFIEMTMRTVGRRGRQRVIRILVPRGQPWALDLIDRPAQDIEIDYMVALAPEPEAAAE